MSIANNSRNLSVRWFSVDILKVLMIKFRLFKSRWSSVFFCRRPGSSSFFTRQSAKIHDETSSRIFVLQLNCQFCLCLPMDSHRSQVLKTIQHSLPLHGFWIYIVTHFTNIDWLFSKDKIFWPGVWFEVLSCSTLQVSFLEFCFFSNNTFDWKNMPKYAC